MLVTLEGIDGTGKSTVCELLSKKFPYAIMTREPQDKAFIEAYSRNNYLKSYAFLMDHAQHVESLIKRKNNDNLIICDRYIDSRCAYQSVELHVPISTIRNMHYSSYSVTPDITFILIGKIDTIMKRLEKRDGPNYYLQNSINDKKVRESLQLDFRRNLEEVQARYIEILKTDSDRCVILDVTDLTVEEVADAIEFALATKFSKKLEYISRKVMERKAIVSPMTTTP